MRAIVVDANSEGGLRLDDAPEPEPNPDQVLVDVRHITLNYGDLNGSRNCPDGFVPGWDASGVVASAAEGGDATLRPLRATGSRHPMARTR